MPARLLAALSVFALLTAHSAAAQAPAASQVPAAAEAPDDTPGVVIDVEHGEPNRVIDGVGWVLGLPNKILLWDKRADNHEVSPKTVTEATEILAEGEVDGVMIRVNQWDPVGEWKRLADNKRVGLGWRATVGAAYTIGYTLVPGRLVGGDWYNPFTDTVHVYSDVPALAMEQAAQAKDVHEKSHPGLYSAVRLVPFIGLMHEARSKQTVFEHVDKHGTTEERAEARRVLHPQMGAEVGGQAMAFVPQGNALMQAGGAVIGHAVGRYQAAKIEAQQKAESSVLASPRDESDPAPEVFGLP